jgi:cysteine desulfurase
VEHHAVLHACQFLAQHEGFELTLLPVDEEGRVRSQALKEAIRPDTVLVSIMAANNEIGTLQPVSELGALCHERDILFHTDAVQWFGKEPFRGVDQFHADLVSVCAHKIYGPKGAGALVVKSPLHPEPLLLGGSHESDQRAGTENLPAIAGLVEALERFARNPVFSRERIEPLADKLIRSIKGVSGARFVGPTKDRLANTVAFVVQNSDSIALLAGLDLEGICASSGSACSAGSLEPSHVVAALGFEPALASSLVRFSLGRDSTVEEVDYVASVLPGVIARAQHGHKRTNPL